MVDEVDLSDLEEGGAGGAGEPAGPQSWPWERLRKEARRLETALQAALSAYGRLGGEVGALRRAGPAGEGAAEQMRARGEVEDTRKRVDAAEERLEDLMAELDEVNTSMAHHVRPGGGAGGGGAAGGGGDNPAYTAQRYVSILRESRAEYARTRSALQANLRHAELMCGHTAGGGGALSSRTDLLLQERGAIQNSRRAAAEILESAIGSREALAAQRGLFGTIGGKLADVGGRFPQVNQLITKISRHKNRDNIVLAGVIASCMFFTFFYSMTRG